MLRPLAVARTLTSACLLLLVSATAPAGDVALRTLDGNDTGLGGIVTQGKWTLVMVWTTYCGVCREQYPIVSAFHERHHERDAVVMGISLDGFEAMEKVARYREDKAHAFPTVVAEAGDFGEKYTQWTGETFTGTPTYLLFDPERGLRAFLDGPVTADALESYIAAN